MKFKFFISLAAILFSAITASAQDYCFQSNDTLFTETISFSLEGNTIVDGEWEHSYDKPGYSAEVYSFTGKKVGNKLLVTFSSFVPYPLPANTKKKAEWVLNTNTLSIPMKKKNVVTKKLEVKTSVINKCPML